ncbi:hypothetical protein HD806DRAFT_478254, partial [Xylariaceae sp. AK1471]
MNIIKVIWNVPKPKSAKLYQALIAANYEAARRSGETVHTLLIRHTDIHNTTTRGGRRVKDEPHVTPSWQTQRLSSLEKFATAHAYTPNVPDFWVKNVIPGPEKPLSATKDGRLIWPSEVNAQAVEEYDKSILEDWADQLQGIKPAKDDEATKDEATSSDANEKA